MPSWAGTGMVTICMLTRRSRSTPGTTTVRPGPRVPSRTRPNRNTSPRSYCLTTRALAANHPAPNPSAAMSRSTNSIAAPAVAGHGPLTRMLARGRPKGSEPLHLVGTIRGTLHSGQSNWSVRGRRGPTTLIRSRNPVLDAGAHRGTRRDGLLDGQRDQVVLAAVRQRVRRGRLVAGPGAGALGQVGHCQVVVGQAAADERVAVHHLAVQADVLEVQPFQVEVQPGLPAHQDRL